MVADCGRCLIQILFILIPACCISWMLPGTLVCCCIGIWLIMPRDGAMPPPVIDMLLSPRLGNMSWTDRGINPIEAGIECPRVSWGPRGPRKWRFQEGNSADWACLLVAASRPRSVFKPQNKSAKRKRKWTCSRSVRHQSLGLNNYLRGATERVSFVYYSSFLGCLVGQSFGKTSESPCQLPPLHVVPPSVSRTPEGSHCGGGDMVGSGYSGY